MAIRVLVIPGSTRDGSFNRKLAHIGKAALQRSGADVSLLDLRELALPLYDGDLEARAGLPEGAVHLRELLKGNDALMFASPEYNGSLSGVLKNALDWASRPHAGEPGGLPYQGKVAALMAASPGALGGLRALQHLRQVLQSLSVLVVSEQFALSKAGEAFAADGSLKEPRQLETIESIARRLVDVTERLKR